MSTRRQNRKRTNSTNSSVPQKLLAWFKFCKKILNLHNFRNLKIHWLSYWLYWLSLFIETKINNRAACMINNVEQFVPSLRNTYWFAIHFTSFYKILPFLVLPKDWNKVKSSPNRSVTLKVSHLKLYLIAQRVSFLRNKKIEKAVTIKDQIIKVGLRLYVKKK